MREAEGDFEARLGGVIEPVRRFLRRRCDPDTVDDVLADTLLVLWRRRDELPATTDADLLPYAYGVARGCLANARRSQERRERLRGRLLGLRASDAAPGAVVGPGDPGDPADHVAAVLGLLPPAQAEVLRLWAWEELGAGEIATVLGITPNAASLRLQRARAGFREHWRQIRTETGHEPGGRRQP
ncbi:RNA polymerase sigma factor [Nocardioides sp.]|uniref:RNA polymerase sigma factor n=1 Tax=Nocardioides sp. TaxID=35761 RepID=UPI003512FFF9